MYTSHPALNVLVIQTNGINYIWLMQDHNIDAKSIKKCECDQFRQLWHSRITNDNNDIYKLLLGIAPTNPAEF